MFFRRFLLAFSIQIIFTSLSFAQIDTLEALSYFPLHVGNKWQFEEYTTLDSLPIKSYRTVTVLGDTLMPNGITYRILENDRHYFRVDTTELKVYLYTADIVGICPNSEILYFDLTYPNNGSFTICQEYEVSVDTGYTRVGNISIFSNHIDFNWYYGITEYYKLSKGFGISEWHNLELVGRDGYLNAAIINGIQYGDFIVGIEDHHPVPSMIELSQNYPNPFNSNTIIRYQLSTSGDIQLSIYNTSGMLITTLVKERINAGMHEVQWNGKNHKNKSVSSGIYYYRLKASNSVETRKMLLIQ